MTEPPFFLYTAVSRGGDTSTLLARAQRAVEIAIEEGEAAGMRSLEGERIE